MVNGWNGNDLKNGSYVMNTMVGIIGLQNLDMVGVIKEL
jgi:hypothetical protein